MKHPNYILELICCFEVYLFSISDKLFIRVSIYCDGLQMKSHFLSISLTTVNKYWAGLWIRYTNMISTYEILASTASRIHVSALLVVVDDANRSLLPLLIAIPGSSGKLTKVKGRQVQTRINQFLIQIPLTPNMFFLVNRKNGMELATVVI